MNQQTSYELIEVYLKNILKIELPVFVEGIQEGNLHKEIWIGEFVFTFLLLFDCLLSLQQI